VLFPRLSFHLTVALVHTTFHLFDFTFPLPHGSVIAGLWIVSSVCQSVRSLPSRLALCDLEAPGWEPRFPHCAVLLLKLTDCGMAFS